MKKLLSALAATILAAAFAMPLNAAPMSAFRNPSKCAPTSSKRSSRKWHRKHYRHWRGLRGLRDRRNAWSSCRYYGSCYPRRYYGYRNYYRPFYPGYCRPVSGLLPGLGT